MPAASSSGPDRGGGDRSEEGVVAGRLALPAGGLERFERAGLEMASARACSDRWDATMCAGLSETFSVRSAEPAAQRTLDGVDDPGTPLVGLAGVLAAAAEQVGGHAVGLLSAARRSRSCSARAAASRSSAMAAVVLTGTARQHQPAKQAGPHEVLRRVVPIGHGRDVALPSASAVSRSPVSRCSRPAHPVVTVVGRGTARVLGVGERGASASVEACSPPGRGSPRWRWSVARLSNVWICGSTTPAPERATGDLEALLVGVQRHLHQPQVEQQRRPWCSGTRPRARPPPRPARSCPDVVEGRQRLAVATERAQGPGGHHPLEDQGALVVLVEGELAAPGPA